MRDSGWFRLFSAAWCFVLLGFATGCICDEKMCGISNEVIETGLWNDNSDRTRNVSSCFRLAPGVWDDDHDIHGLVLTGGSVMRRLDGIAFSFAGTMTEGGGNGVMISPFNVSMADFNGLLLGLWNVRRDGVGLSVGLLNDYMIHGDTEMSGIQLGMVNVCGFGANLLQLGMVNFASDDDKVIQLGLWNYNGIFGMPLINLVFGSRGKYPPTPEAQKCEALRRIFPELVRASRIADPAWSDAEISRVLKEKNYSQAELDFLLDVYGNEANHVLRYRFNANIVSILRRQKADAAKPSSAP